MDQNCDQSLKEAREDFGGSAVRVTLADIEKLSKVNDRGQAQHELACLDRDQILTLTSHDLNKHRRALVRIQEKLFKTHSMEDYCFIPKSLEIIPPSASFLVLGSEVVRTLSLGGFTYDVNCPNKDEKLKLSITHKEGTIFGIFITVTTESASFQRIATTIEFEILERGVYRAIQTALSDYTLQIRGA